jgi:DNA-binding NarL/FixJ family response regulator
MVGDRRTAVLLDHHPLWLDAIQPVLDKAGVDVAGRTDSAATALALLKEHNPDLFVVEPGTPTGEFDTGRVRDALRVSPGTKVLVLSEWADAREIDDALSAGAAAFVVKTAHPDDLGAAVRQTFEHSVYLAGGRTMAEPRPKHIEPAADLTRRELEILRLVAEGHSNAGLAKMLWVTEQTVKFHLSNIYRKLNVANRTEASRWAQLNGILSDGPAHARSDAGALASVNGNGNGHANGNGYHHEVNGRGRVLVDAAQG